MTPASVLLKPFACRFCCLNYNSVDKLRRHHNRHWMRYTQTYNRRSHNWHDQKRMWYNKSSIDLAVKIQNTRYQCGYCWKSFPNPTVLGDHLRTHTGDGNPYKCAYCEKTFVRHSSLKQHTRTHTKEKPYECEYCQRCFSETYALRLHIKIHTNEKPYQCMNCDKAYISKGTLNKHIKTHTAAIQCPHCNDMFTTEQAVTKHMKTTHGKDRYKCSVCSKSFKTDGFLKRHKSLHITKQKPFKCEYCQKSYKRKDGLKRHMQTHENC